MEITEPEIRTEVKVVQNIQAAISTVTSHKATWEYEAQWLPSLWKLKKHKAGTKFASDTNRKQAVTSWLQTLYINFFYTVVQYNNLRVFLGFFVMWIVFFCCLFLFITWIAYSLERDTEDVDEVYDTFEYVFINVFLYLYSESVMFFLNYINRSVNGF